MESVRRRRHSRAQQCPYESENESLRPRS